MRRILTLLLTLLSALTLHAADAPKPNIVFIFADGRLNHFEKKGDGKVSREEFVSP